MNEQTPQAAGGDRGEGGGRPPRQGGGEPPNITIRRPFFRRRKSSPFSGDDAATLQESGLRVPVRWANHDSLPVTDTPLRLKVDVGPVSRDCPRPDDVKIYAAYVGSASGQ